MMSKITSSSVLELVKRQGFRCALTGLPLTPATASLDHVQPLSQGGMHEIENCQVVRSDINRAKGTMNNEQFIAMCRAVVSRANGVDETEDDDLPLFCGPTDSRSNGRKQISDTIVR